MSLHSLFAKHRARLVEVLSHPNGEQAYPELATELGISDDDAIKLLRMTPAANSHAAKYLDNYSWPSLISLDTPTLPPLDLSDFPSWMGKFAQATADATETPTELAGGITLAVVATAAARRTVVKINDGYQEPTCLWVAPALEPANLKSAVVSACQSPLQAWESTQAEQLQPEIKASVSEQKTKEARIKALRAAAVNVKAKPSDVQKWTNEIAELESSLEDIPVLPRLWTSDATPETFGSMLGQQGECMSLISSEGAIIDIMAGRYSGGSPNFEIFLKGHSGDSDVTDRLSRDSVRLDFPRVSIGISPQPEVFNELASMKGGEGKGLTARFLYFLPASRLGYRTLDGPPTPPEVKKAYHEGIQAMLEWPMNTQAKNGCHVLELSDSARECWQEYRHWVESEMRPDGSLANHKKWSGKSAGAAVRIAGIMHSALYANGRPWELPIQRDTMESALNVIKVTMEHSKAVLSAMRGDEAMNNAKVVLEWARRKHVPSMTIRTIHAELKHKLPRSKNVKNAVEYLQERGYLYVSEQEPTGGRPASPIVIFRPVTMGLEK